MGDYQKNPVVPTRVAAFASDHGLPQERFYNLVCLAFGANSQEFADFVSLLPPTRSPSCSHEYQTLVRAFRQQIRPHIDQEQARAVLDTDWLEQVEATSPSEVAELGDCGVLNAANFRKCWCELKLERTLFIIYRFLLILISRLAEHHRELRLQRRRAQPL